MGCNVNIYFFMIRPYLILNQQICFHLLAWNELYAILLLFISYNLFIGVLLHFVHFHRKWLYYTIFFGRPISGFPSSHAYLKK